VTPTLEVSLRPLSVTGRHFDAGEEVTVLVSLPPELTSGNARADDDGTFTLEFPDAPDRRVTIVRATGSRGHAALWSPQAKRTTSAN
jgi:hypothetical protein